MIGSSVFSSIAPVSKGSQGVLHNISIVRSTALGIFSSQLLRPRDSVTFCNLFVQLFFSRMGYNGFKGMLASDMVRFARSSGDFLRVGIRDAISAAVAGQPSFAGLEGSPHGHVCILLDSTPSFSQRFDQMVPHCVDVGKNYRWDVPISFAFRSMPEFFILKGGLPKPKIP